MNNLKDSNEPNLADDIAALDERNRKEERVLRGLLDQCRDKKNHFLAVSANMGDSHSYISSVPLAWFADVHFASDMEIFKEFHDEKGKSVAINNETLDLLSQRKPDWRRQLVMTAYLSIRKHRKFPPVLLVAYQDWVFNSNDDNWGSDKRALRDSVTHKSLDSESWIVDFNHSGTNFYALDGQHRLMAVKGLRDLLDGKLAQRKKDGDFSSKSITIEDIFQHDSEGMTESEFRTGLNSIMEEKIGVEIIPAVQVGETRKEAFARLRQIFVDVNQNAKKLEKGELALLDETDGFSIVARHVMVLHPLFRDKSPKNKDESPKSELLVDTKSGQLSEKSDNYTTLQTIVEVAKLYLGQLDGPDAWDNELCGIKGAGSLRPTDEQIEEGRKKLSAYFDAMMTLPSHDRMIKGTPVNKLRSREEGCDDNILFRPITQEALAEAIGEMERENGLAPKEIIKKLSEKDNPDEPNLRLTDPASPFFGILCDPVDKKMRRQEKYKNLATRMFKYLLGGGIQDDTDREKLRVDVFESRRIASDGTGEAKATGYDEKQIPLREFKLLPPW